MAYATFSVSTAVLDLRVVMICLAFYLERQWMLKAPDSGLAPPNSSEKPATSCVFDYALYAGCDVEHN